jgi:3-keto-5-aminohexanoate cleavage enzyme
MGGNARTGMEDTLTLSKGVPAASNLQLVERLVGIAESMQLEPATVAEVVERLKLSPELVNPS